MKLEMYRGLKKYYSVDGSLISRDCSKCKKHKEFSEFPKTKNKKYKDGILGQCNECKSIYFKKYSKDNGESLKAYREGYYDKNKGLILSKNRKYFEKNKETIIQKRKEWFEKNKERVSEYRKEWCEVNRERLNEYKKIYTSRRRSLIKDNNFLSVEEWNDILYLFEYKCPLTDSSNITIEHFIPLSKGGSTSILNCYPLDASLNFSKNNKNPFEWHKLKKDKYCISDESWLNLILYLSKANNMSVEEFTIYVNGHFDEVSSHE